MKTKTSNRLNIILIAIALLLVFVVANVRFGNTNSWLVDKDEVGFVVTVENINIKVKQTIGTGQEQTVREITKQDNKIYFGTNILQADTPYDLKVSITNEDEGEGFYIRCRAFAVINGTTYNINNYLVSDLYKNSDGWLYVTESIDDDTPIPMASGEAGKKMLIDTVTFPSSIIGSLQGKYVGLYLYIEGSPSIDFDV